MKFIPVLLFYGLILNACTPPSKTNSKRSSAVQRAITPADSLIQKLNAGTDFIASGTAPELWKLEMDFDDKFHFESPSTNTFFVPTVRPERRKDISADRYITNRDTGQMVIFVYDQLCATKVRPQTSKIVEVTIGDKRYTGCGKYLYDPRLNHIWILESIDNSKLNAAEYPKAPEIEFDLLESKMTGYDGCKKISSTIEIQGSRIKFSSFSTSTKACSNNAAEKIFAEKLSGQLVDHQWKDGKLVLYLIDDSRLTFRRKN